MACPALCDPMVCSLPGSSVHGILQARILERVAIPFFRGSSWPRDQTQVSCIAGRFFTLWTTREDLGLIQPNSLMWGHQRQRFPADSNLPAEFNQISSPLTSIIFSRTPHNSLPDLGRGQVREWNMWSLIFKGSLHFYPHCQIFNRYKIHGNKPWLLENQHMESNTDVSLSGSQIFPNYNQILLWEKYEVSLFIHGRPIWLPWWLRW